MEGGRGGVGGEEWRKGKWADRRRGMEGGRERDRRRGMERG